MIALSATLRPRWRSGRHVGSARPTQTVAVQRGHLERKFDTDGEWTAVWTPDEDPKVLPGIAEVSLEWSFDSNGIQTATVDMANVYARELAGALGAYHRMERGWYSPLRSWAPPKRPQPVDMQGKRIGANQWDRVLGETALVSVSQGYGDEELPTFAGLIDTVNGRSSPSTLRLTARDMGQLLTDVHPFGWNVRPSLQYPVTFVDIGHQRRLEKSNDPANRKLAEHYRRSAVIIRDVTDIAAIACRWAGFPKGSLRISRAGTSIKQTVAFGPGEFLIDMVKKVQDATGMTFFIGHPTADWPLGRPTLRMSNTSWTVPKPVEEIRDDQLLTDFNWQHTDEPLAGIIRVRGKDVPDDQGGRPLGKGFVPTALMAVYRPPWHRFERDARVIKHVIHTEPLYTSQYQCAVAARMIALQEALAANTGQLEVSGHPGLELDDIAGLIDRATGINSRLGVASLQSTFSRTPAGEVAYKMTAGVTLLDTPDVVQVVNELGTLLRAGSRLHPEQDIGTALQVTG